MDISHEILELIRKSQTTVMKLYNFVNGDDAIPSPEEFKKFKDGLIVSIKKKRENALQLFPIIKYFENKRMTDIDYEYDKVLFTVKEDEKIAIASPIEVLEEKPQKGEYDLKVLWDLSNLDERETMLFKAAENYFSLIQNDEGLKRFVKHIGTHTNTNWELLFEEKELFMENVPQEVFALYQSGDLNNLLPIEIMQLDDEDLETVFLKNFIETKLLTYQLWGIEREMQEEWVIRNQDMGEKGPLFICLDTSGSMRGLTEVIAKAITMMVVDQLENFGKNIVFVPFSTNARMMDLYGVSHKLKLTKMQLKKSYYGGTCINKLISLIDQTITQKKYEKTNVLIISDFVFKNLSKQTIEKIEKIKSKSHKFHALNISEKKFNNKIYNLFNSVWSYTFNWRGMFENNEEELLQELSTNSNTSSEFYQGIQSFGIIKKLMDKDFVPLPEEHEETEKENFEEKDLTLDEIEELLE